MMDILGGPWGIIILYWLVDGRGVWPRSAGSVGVPIPETPAQHLSGPLRSLSPRRAGEQSRLCRCRRLQGAGVPSLGWVTLGPGST